MPLLLNQKVLMSGARYFDDSQAINAFMNAKVPINCEVAQAEHDQITAALRQAGVEVVQVDPPADCQDGVYTANWALVRGDTAVMANLPQARKGEEPYAEQVLQDLGFRTVRLPADVRFSGQGDALPCGNLLFTGTGYRTDKAAHELIAQHLGYEVISLQTIPQRTWFHRPVINAYSGWPDSFFYDIDLALSILRPPTDDKLGLIAYCPDAFLPASRKFLRQFDKIEKIEISFAEAKHAFACNLVSTGETVIMSSVAPQLKTAIEAHGLKTITPAVTELAKGGGYIRCTSLALSNQ